jgi:hypothetical protein
MSGNTSEAMPVSFFVGMKSQWQKGFLMTFFRFVILFFILLQAARIRK